MKFNKIALISLVFLSILLALWNRFSNSFENYEEKIRNDSRTEILKVMPLDKNSATVFSKSKDGITYTKLETSLFGIKEIDKGYQGISEFIKNKGFSVLGISSEEKIVLFGMINELNVDFIRLEFEDLVIVPNIILSDQGSYWYYSLEKNETIKYKSVIIKAFKDGVMISELIYEFN